MCLVPVSHFLAPVNSAAVDVAGNSIRGRSAKEILQKSERQRAQPAQFVLSSCLFIVPLCCINSGLMASRLAPHIYPQYQKNELQDLFRGRSERVPYAQARTRTSQPPARALQGRDSLCIAATRKTPVLCHGAVCEVDDVIVPDAACARTHGGCMRA